MFLLFGRVNPALEPRVSPWAVAATGWLIANLDHPQIIAREMIEAASPTPFDGLAWGCGSGRRNANDAGGRCWQWLANRAQTIADVLEPWSTWSLEQETTHRLWTITNMVLVNAVLDVARAWVVDLSLVGATRPSGLLLPAVNGAVAEAFRPPPEGGPVEAK